MLTVAIAEAVHPLDVLVAVTVNVPGLVTLIEAVVAPLLHDMVEPEEATAVTVDEVNIQFSM